jgi:aminoacrylate hydrolase
MPLIGTRDGFELHCETAGKPDGEALLLVTGLGGNASFWAEQAPRFGKTFRTITYDHRGTGRSSQPLSGYSLEQMAGDALAVLDGLGIARAHVVGHSTGGCIGQILAIDHPQRMISLVASSSWTAADAYFRRLFEVRKRALLEGGPTTYVRCGTLFQYPPEWITANMAAIEIAEAATLAAFPPSDIVLGKIDAILAFDRRSDLHRIRVPTLVNTAMDDAICPPYFSRALAAAIPDARLEILQSGGHFCPRTQPDAFFGNLSTFFRDVAGTAGRSA